jgi:hypothetical protein
MPEETVRDWLKEAEAMEGKLQQQEAVLHVMIPFVSEIMPHTTNASQIQSYNCLELQLPYKWHTLSIKHLWYVSIVIRSFYYRTSNVKRQTSTCA